MKGIDDYMKRIVSLFVLLVFLIQTFVCFNVFADNSETEVLPERVVADDKARLLDALNIISVSEYEAVSSTVISRGYFADMIGGILGGDGEVSMSGNRYFKDVALNNRYAAGINALYERGIVKGTEDKIFEPEANIKPVDAAVMLLRLAGYETIATINGGYDKLIAKYDLLDDVSSLESMTCRDAVSMIYTTLLMPMCTSKVYSDTGVDYNTDNDYTVMYEFFKVYTHTGILYSAEGISLKLDEKTAEDRITVGDITYVSNLDGTYQLLGYEVNAYIKEDKEYVDEAIYVSATKRNEVTEIKLQDLLPVGTSLNLSFYSEKTERQKSIQLPANTVVIKNGTVLSKLQDIINAFNAEQGIVKVINNGLRYVAVISEYESVVVSKVNSNDSKIYVKHGTTIDFNSNNIKRIRFYDGEGNPCSAENLTEDTLLTVLSSKDNLEVYVSSNIVIGTVNLVNKDYISIDGSKFVIEPAYKTEANTKIKAGTAGTFFLNIYGEIAYFTASNVVSGTYGFLIHAQKEVEFDTILKLKIYSADGEMFAAETIARPKIDGKKMSKDDAYTALDKANSKTGATDVNFAQPVLFVLSDDGKFAEIDTLAANSDGKTGFRAVADYETDGPSTNADAPDDGSRKYSSGQKMFLPDVALSSGVKTIQIPMLENISEPGYNFLNQPDSKYRILNLVDTEAYRCAGYTAREEGFLADFVVVQSNTFSTVFSATDWPYMVAGVETVYDITDEEEKLKLTLGGRFGTNSGLFDVYVSKDYMYEAGDLSSAYDNPGVPLEDPSTLSAGDMIRIVTDNDNCIIKIKVLYDADNASQSPLNIMKKHNISTGGGRYVAGKVIGVQDGYVKLETANSNWPVEYLKFSTSVPVVVYDSKKREKEVYVGGIGDLIVYGEADEDASVVVPVTINGGETRAIFIYKHLK